MAEKDHRHIEPGEISLPPNAQQSLLQMQAFQQQYQGIAVQKEALTMQKLELEKALEELGKAKDGEEVYKAVGPILVKSTKTELHKELGERKETIDLRLNALDKQETKIKEKLQELQGKLESMFKQASSSKAA